MNWDTRYIGGTRNFDGSDTSYGNHIGPIFYHDLSGTYTSMTSQR